MSDTSQGPGWWQASDGKWYAPELYPSDWTPDDEEAEADQPVDASPPDDTIVDPRATSVMSAIPPVPEAIADEVDDAADAASETAEAVDPVAEAVDPVAEDGAPDLPPIATGWEPPSDFDGRATVAPSGLADSVTVFDPPPVPPPAGPPPARPIEPTAVQPIVPPPAAPAPLGSANVWDQPPAAPPAPGTLAPPAAPYPGYAPVPAAESAAHEPAILPAILGFLGAVLLAVGSFFDWADVDVDGAKSGIGAISGSNGVGTLICAAVLVAGAGMLLAGMRDWWVGAGMVVAGLVAVGLFLFSYIDLGGLQDDLRASLEAIDRDDLAETATVTRTSWLWLVAAGSVIGTLGGLLALLTRD